jgi:hypothetical protein
MNGISHCLSPAFGVAETRSLDIRSLHPFIRLINLYVVSRQPVPKHRRSAAKTSPLRGVESFHLADWVPGALVADCCPVGVLAHKLCTGAI